MNLGEILSEYIGEAIVGGISALTAWYFTKRRDTAETRVIEADAIANMQTVYDHFVADTKNKIEELVAEIAKLTAQVRDLSVEIKLLEKDLDDCRKGVHSVIVPTKPRKN